MNDIAPGASKAFSGPGGKSGILLNVEGTLKAFVNYCPHQGGEVALVGCNEGTCRLQCTLHGALFDPFSGMCLSGPPPAGSSLRELVLVVEGGNIYY